MASASSTSSDLINQLNKIGKCEKVKVSPEEMEINKIYPVLWMEKVNTQFGDTVTVEIKEGILYLPKRLSKSIIERGSLEVLTQSQLGIKYLGKKATGSANAANLFEIVKI